MKVALFFDGKNFYKGLTRFNSSLQVDYKKFAKWMTEKVAGPSGVFVGAHYYTGFLENSKSTFGRSFHNFLSSLEQEPGYFVQREPRVVRTHRCRLCGGTSKYDTEKRVDTRIVADLIHYAHVGSFDIAVLSSGDQDMIPATEAVKRIGKRINVATWGYKGLSRDLRVSAFDIIDLRAGANNFSTTRPHSPFSRPKRAPLPTATAMPSASASRPAPSPASPTTTTTPASAPAAPATSSGSASVSLTSAEDACLKSVQKALAVMKSKASGYLSEMYFINKWLANPPVPAAGLTRKAVVDSLVAKKLLQRKSVSSPTGASVTVLEI